MGEGLGMREGQLVKHILNKIKNRRGIW